MRRVLRLFGMIALVVGAPACLDADSFLFDGKKVDEYALPGNTIPAAQLEAIRFSSGNHELHGYYVRANAAATTTILYFHGNKHNLDEFWNDVLRLYDTGADVLIFDYRGYGRSEGELSGEADLLADADAAGAYLRDRGVAPAATCLYGFSLGTVAAIHLAASGPAYRCLIAQSGFASLTALVQGASFLPLRERWVNEASFDSAKVIADVAARVLVLHGDEDETARFDDNGRVLFANAPEPKRLELVRGAQHNDVPETLGRRVYVQLIRDWITGP